MKHWTNTNAEFALAITLDVLAQMEERLDQSPISRADYAQRLGVQPSRVSQIFNAPEKENPTIKSLVEYARALGIKVSIVAYDDDDPENFQGPIFSEVFAKSWEKLGRPRDLAMFQPITHVDLDGFPPQSVTSSTKSEEAEVMLA